MEVIEGHQTSPHSSATLDCRFGCIGGAGDAFQCYRLKELFAPNLLAPETVGLESMYFALLVFLASLLCLLQLSF